MGLRTVCIILIVLGVLMMIYTGFNYVTVEKVVDVGPLEINKEKNHWVSWPPIVGLVLIVGGIVGLVFGKRER